jgi:hypothetical protein
VIRHQLIKSLMAQRTEKVADGAIDLWEQMATQIISIVGEGGFNTLFARSVFLAQATFPWLAAISKPAKADPRVADLKSSLEGQTPMQATQANILLLTTFTDILSSIIGEELTINILRSAWHIDTPDAIGDEKLLPGHPKEFQNER